MKKFKYLAAKFHLVFKMGLRPAKIYRKIPGKPYTRISYAMGRSYIAGAPAPRISIFEMGTKGKEYPVKVSLVLEKDCCIRSNALEALRVTANSYLNKRIPGKNYFLRIEVYPHHITRYHPIAGVAQADRYYQGMSKPFGRPDGRAAIVKRGQEVLSIYIDRENLNIGKTAAKRARMKLPVGAKIVIH